jgi:transcriptional regulator with XRE-family HTH domain
MQTLGEYLKTNREAAEVTQKELQAKLGYKSSQFISNWERGVSVPPVKAIPVIAEAFGVDKTFLADKVAQGIIDSFSQSTKEKYGV